MRARPLAVLVALLALAALADAGLLRWRVVHGLRVSGIPITLNITINGTLGLANAAADQATPSGQVDPVTRYASFPLTGTQNIEFVVYNQATRAQVNKKTFSVTDGDYRTLALVSYTGLPTPVMVLLDDNAPPVSNENFTIGFFNGQSDSSFLNVTVNDTTIFNLSQSDVAYPAGVYQWQITTYPSSRRRSSTIGTFPTSGYRLFGNTAITVFVLNALILPLAQRATLDPSLTFTTAPPTTPPPTTLPPNTSPAPTVTANSTATPAPTTPGQCVTTNDCGLVPKIDSLTLVYSCCNGQWIIDIVPNAAANDSTPNNIEVFAGTNIVINNFWNLTVIDTLVIHIDGSGNRRRQGQAALAKVEVNGDAYVDGRLEIIVDSDPQPALDTTPVPVVAIVPSSNGTLTGQFREPVRVTLAYAGASCARGSAKQSADNAGISALVTVDSAKNCGGGSGGGLSRNAKIAIGVVCGVVGLLLLALLAFFLIRTLAPDSAVKLGLKKADAVTLGHSYSKRNMGRL